MASVFELTKHAQTVSIPNAVSQINLPVLSTLSNCYDSGIEGRTSMEIQTILFKTEVGRHKLDALLESAELLLGVVRKRAASSDTLRNTLPNVILLSTIIHHIILGLGNKDSVTEKLKTKFEFYRKVLEEIEYPQSSEIEVNLLSGTKMMIIGLEKAAKSTKASRLQIGNWKEELQKEHCRSSLSKNLSKMSMYERYSLIARLLVEVSFTRQIGKLIMTLHYMYQEITTKKTF